MAIEKLNRIRASLRLSQQTLADRSGLSKTTIVDAEKGRPIRLLTAYAILDVLNEELRQRGQSEVTVDNLDWNVQG
jgi:DNA-binding XRE family transcriptional regulator